MNISSRRNSFSSHPQPTCLPHAPNLQDPAVWTWYCSTQWATTNSQRGFLISVSACDKHSRDKGLFLPTASMPWPQVALGECAFACVHEPRRNTQAAASAEQPGKDRPCRALGSNSQLIIIKAWQILDGVPETQWLNSNSSSTSKLRCSKSRGTVTMLQTGTPVGTRALSSSTKDNTYGKELLKQVNHCRMKPALAWQWRRAIPHTNPTSSLHSLGPQSLF